MEPFKGHKEAIKCLAFSIDEDLLASGGKDNLIFLWNVSTGKMEKSLEGHLDTVTCLDFSGNGKNICSGNLFFLN